MMMRFVLDEWVWADLNGKNGEEAQRETLHLLICVFEKCDQLVAVEGSAFLKKYYEMTKNAAMGDLKRQAVKVFKGQFLHNSQKLLLISKESLMETSSEIVHKVKEDDRYLVQALDTAEADLLVTTDGPLIEALKECGRKCQHRDEFMSAYLGKTS